MEPHWFAALAPNSPERAVPAVGRAREDDLASVGSPIESANVPHTGGNQFGGTGASAVTVQGHHQNTRVEHACVLYKRECTAIRRNRRRPVTADCRLGQLVRFAALRGKGDEA